MTVLTGQYELRSWVRDIHYQHDDGEGTHVHVPVSEQHRHIHSSEDEDDVEPGILNGVT